MRSRWLLVSMAALASPARAAAADPAKDPAAAPAASPGAVEVTSPAAAPVAPPAVPAIPSAAEPAWRRGYVATVGAGYYERVHVGVAYELSRASSLGLFGGSDFGLGDDSTWTLGLSYAHALRKVAGRFELGLDGKALYWEQSDPDYDWKMMTLVFGAYLARELSPGLSLGLDAGVALSFSLETDRKQNVNYEYPNRWNGSVALALQYRFDRW